jgi:ubiquinone/menaquinone biosynthesis C-methylase UbiE
MPIEDARSLQEYYDQTAVAEGYLEKRFSSPSGQFHHSTEWALVRGFLDSAKNVVELACGPARFGNLAPDLRGYYLGLDTSRNMLTQASRHWPHLSFVQGSALELPLADQSIDALVSLRFLRHLIPTDRQRVYREALRVLDLGGLFIFDACNEVRHRGLVSKRFVYDELYTESTLRSEMSEAGFRIRQLSGYLYQDNVIRYLQGLARRLPKRDWHRPVRLLFWLRYRYERILSLSGGKAPYLWLVLCQKRGS